MDSLGVMTQVRNVIWRWYPS